MGRVAFAKVNVTVTGFAKTRPSGSNLRMGLAAVMPAGGVASVVDTVIIVVVVTAPAGMSRCALLSASATVPPCSGVTADVAVCVGVLPPPDPQPTSAAAQANTEQERKKDTPLRPVIELDMALSIGG